MTPRVQRAINIFLDALNEGTLAKGTCTACAVGNLVSAGMGGKILPKQDPLYLICDKPNSNWGKAFSSTGTGKQIVNPNGFADPYVQDCIESTEFSAKELMIIENTFEKNTHITYQFYYDYSKEAVREDQINGLKAVVEAMMTFDNCKEPVQEVFTSKAELIPV